MKKKILGGLLVVAIAAVAAFNVNMNTENTELSSLALANVEALASGESGGGTSHSLSCGSAGIKMCEGKCGIHQVTVKNYGNGQPSKFTCGS